ncbi:DUF4124 domain-containing protein [Proteobacteria bacterium 005FR1]|nr:DUF4124 domain-containing protein [Proteobacteria bacterium 005FR1]
MRTSVVFATGLAGLFIAVAASADIYRWTDENGRVHFSDKPPRDREAENISERTRSVNVDTSSGEREKLNELFAPESPEEKRLRQQREVQRTAQAEKQRLVCEKAQRELRFFKEERFYWVDESGNSKNASEQERQQMIEQLSTAIQRHCS